MSDTLWSDAFSNPFQVAIENLGSSVFGLIRSDRKKKFMNIINPNSKKSDPSLDAILGFLENTPNAYAIHSVAKSIGGKKVLNLMYDSNEYITNKYLRKISSKTDKKILKLVGSKSRIKRAIGKTAKFGREFYVEEVK